MAELREATVRDLGYRRYEGPRTHRAVRIWAMARTHLRSTLRRKGVRRLLLLTLLPTIVACVVAVVNERWMGSRASEDLVGLQTSAVAVILPSFFMTLFTGAGAIAEDARAGAFSLYFSRPPTTTHYLLGKLAGVLPPVALTALLPPTLLCATLIGFAHSSTEVAIALRLLAGALFVGGLWALSLSMLCLAVSSFVRSRGASQASFGALFLLPYVTGEILASTTRSPWPKLVSLPTHLASLAHLVAGVEAAETDRLFPGPFSLLILAAIGGGLWWLLVRRLGRTEVVAG